MAYMKKMRKMRKTKMRSKKNARKTKRIRGGTSFFGKPDVKDQANLLLNRLKYSSLKDFKKTVQGHPDLQHNVENDIDFLIEVHENQQTATLQQIMDIKNKYFE
jgi:hypothetical protein